MSTTEAAGATRAQVSRGNAGRPPVDRRTELRNVLVALIVAAAVCAVMWRGVARTITDQTDVIGYPVFFDFNIHRYFSYFHIVAYWLPGIALAVYAALTLLTRRRARQSAAATVAARAEQSQPATAWAPLAVLGRVARTLMVGGVFGLEVAVWQSGEHPLRVLTGVAVGWLVAVHVAAWMGTLIRPSTPLSVVASGVNALAAPLGIAGLLLVSSVTRVLTEDDGREHPYPWLPWWVALLFTAAALLMVLRPLLRAPGPAARLVVERRAIVYLSIPLALFITVASIPGALPAPGWVFEEGHWLAGQHFITSGMFPWRDYLFDHGLFDDTLRSLASVAAFGGSRWASGMGDAVLWGPAFILGMYYLAAYLLEARNLAILVAVAVVLAVGGPLVGVSPNSRFVLWGYIVLVLLATLRKPARWRPALLGVLITAQAVLVPESAYCAIAVFIALAGFELTHRDGRPLLRSLPRTAWYVGSGVTLTLVFVAILVSQHSLGAFVNYYVIFLDSHEIAGGIPLLPWTPWYLLWAAAPIAGWLATVAYTAAKVRRGRRLDAADWTLIGAAILSVLYYGKFLGRADLHVLQVYTLSIPMFVLLTYVAVSAMDHGALRVPRIRLAAPRLGGRPASLLFAVVTVALLAQPLAASATGGAGRYRPGVATEPWLAKLGYATPDSLDPVVYRDLEVVVDTYVGEGGRIEDFSNETGIWYFLFGLYPPTPYYHIALAIPETAQEDMVKRLAADPPTLAVMSNGYYGLPSWDGIANQVRHHTVAQWIYDHYRPLMVVDTHVFYVLDSATVPPPSTIASRLSKAPVTSDVAFTMVCDWGHVPDHLSVLPSAEEQAAATTAWSGGGAPAGRLSVSAPPGRTWADYHWLEIDSDAGFSGDAWKLHQGVDDIVHTESFLTTAASPHRYFVHVGGCAAWHGYTASAPVVLEHQAAAQITAVRLVP